jgi:hypothetical protein
MYVKKPLPSLPSGEGTQTNQAGTQGAGKPGSPEDLPRETASALAGLDGAWAEYAPVDCLMCGRLLTCKDRDCQTDHEHSHAWMCDECMETARTKLRASEVKA